MTRVAVGEVVRFGEFELDLEREELRLRGEAVAIQPQPLRALALLVNHGGRLVSREQMQQALWGDSPYLDVDRSLNHTIRKLRLVLDDDARSPSLIQTVPRRGYRFIGKTEPAIEAGGRGFQAGAFRRESETQDSVFSGESLEPPGAEASGILTYIRILPFRDIADETSWPRLADGVVEELISTLVRLRHRQLVVIDAVAGENGQPESTKPMRDYLLRGAVRRTGTCVRVHAHLVQRHDGRVVGTAVFEERLEGLFELQKMIAERIAGMLIEPLLEEPVAELEASPAAGEDL